MNYYNEFDPFAAAWLRELIKAGLIPEGDVDERSITDVKPSDLKGYTQCHFFTGIGGWSYALELAGWSADRPVWTGSPPCQPFSTAGNQKGKDDERHLWPHFFELIRECKPATVFGEQVASAIRHNWFDDLQTDMEREGYAAGMVVLPACSIGAPHKRDRLFYVANRLADTGSERQQGQGGLGRPGYSEESEDRQVDRVINASGIDSTVAKSDNFRSVHESIGGSIQQDGSQSYDESTSGCSSSRSSTMWNDSRFIYCRDGKYRPIPVEPSLFPLLPNGIPNRVGILRGAGNAIVPQIAAEVIKAFMETN
jgi:DNA (cytosine-5)-methyltransferase 1